MLFVEDPLNKLNQSFFLLKPTKCVTNLDYGYKMIIFESILTSNEASVIFKAPSWGGS